MKSLIFLVEGETEQEFVNRLLAPYLIQSRGLNTEIRSIMIEKSGGGHGYSNIEHFKNTIIPFLHSESQPVITTMIDHYGINSERKMPGYDSITHDSIAERIAKMEDILEQEVLKLKPYRFFIPYIQQHELETLLFANPKDGFDLEDERIRNDVIELCSQFESIEEINCTPQGAPSKRLAEIYKRHNRKYQKVIEAVDIIELGGGIEPILDKCPRFKQWITKLTEMVKGKQEIRRQK